MQANWLAFLLSNPFDLLLPDAGRKTCGMVLHAVLTGDLVLSTRSTVAEIDRTMDLIESSALAFDPSTRFQRYRGDGWQIYAGAAGQGLGAMVLVAASLAAAEALSSRIALGLGTVEGLQHDSLGRAGGGAFVASGRALDKMTAGQRLAMAGAGVDPLHHALLSYIDAQTRGWSPQQAEAVALSIGPATRQPQQTRAAGLGISRQAFAARLATAGFPLVEQAIHAFSTRFQAEQSDG
jgi:hypothetical protein